MGAPRKFDYDEAKRLRAEGLSLVEIGSRLGVSDTTIRRAINESYRRKQYLGARQRIEAKREPCAGGCGRLVWKHTRRKPDLCIVCSNRARKVVRHGTESEYSFGCRCDDCRTAATEARRRRRQVVAA